MKPARVEVTIDDLVLHGFKPGDRYAIAEGLQQELTRLLVEQGVPTAFTQEGEVQRLDGGSFPMTPAAKGESVGTQAAQAVFGGLQS
jgi:hypothetical protein